MKVRLFTVKISPAKKERRNTLFKRDAEVSPRAPAVVPIAVGKLRAVNRKRPCELIDMLFHDDVHRASDAVGTVNGRSRTAHHFNAFHCPGRRHEDAARFKAVQAVHGRVRVLSASVNHEQRVVRREPADINLRSAHLGSRDVYTRHITDSRADIADRLCHQFLGINDGDGSRRFPRVLRIAGSRNNGGVERGIAVVGRPSGGNGKCKRKRCQKLVVMHDCEKNGQNNRLED